MPGRDFTPRERFARAIAVISGVVWAGSAHAAGGHFGVDDAGILDLGTCQVETWWERADHASSVLHLGPACRVGPVELGINVDRIQPRDHGPQTPVSVQAKWALPIDDRLSVGLAALVAWQVLAPRYAGASVYVPLTL